MTTDQFIDALAQRKLISDTLAQQLHAKAAQGDDRITPKAILKYLVKKEIIGRPQAAELLKTMLVVSDRAESSILGLAPLAAAPPKPEANAPRAASPPAKKAASQSPPPEPPQRAAGDDLFTSASAPGAPVELFPYEADPLSAAEEGAGDERLAGAASKKGKKRSKKSKKDRKKNEWDSPVLLLGGGALALLVVAGIALYWLIFRENADAILKEANELHDAGSYTQAIANYKRFLEEAPGHQQYSQVKVRLGMTQLRKATEGTSDFAGALETAQGVVSEIEDEEAFLTDGDEDGVSEAKRDLSTLLTEIAVGLAAQADAETDPATIKTRIEQTNTVLTMLANTKYVPQRLRSPEIDGVKQTLELVKARQVRDADLADAVVKIDEALKAGDTSAAFAIRQELVDKYPVLLNDESLAKKVAEISAAEQAGIKYTASEVQALVEPAPSRLVAELVLASRHGSAAPADGQVVVRADGAVYGLNAKDGAVRWRRFVGASSNDPPLVTPDGRVIVADASAQELICIDPAGKQLWRQPLEGKLAAPVIAGEKLLVASDAAKLYVVNAADGALLGHVQFSQPLYSPPALNDRGDRCYVVGEHSSIYTLSTENFSCIGVFYSAHAAGGIAAPPLAMFNKVVVADNSGAETCTIRVLSLDERGAAAAQVAEKRLDGLVVTPLMPEKRRFAVVTTLGQATVFEVAAANDQSALTVLVGREAQDREQLARFGLLHNGHLWVAGRQLMKLAVLPTGNQLAVRSLPRDYQGDAFDYPVQALGGAVVHVRRPAGQGGVIVAALDESANKPAWETQLAAPPAGSPAVDPAAALISAGSSSGAVFAVDREAMARRVQDNAKTAGSAPISAPPFTASVDLGKGRLAISGVGSTKVIVFDPASSNVPPTEVTLPGPLASPPVAWRDGFVAASEVGQVFFYPADGSEPAATPFQPELTPGRKYNWRRPAVVGSGDASQFVVSDGVERIYLVGYAAQPQPHLEAVKSADVGPSPLVSPLAIVGDRVAAATEAGKLAMFAIADLAPAEPLDLGGRAKWGPFAVEDGLLLALDTDELVFVGADGAIRWRRPLKHGPLAGEPLAANGEAILLHAAGSVERVKLANGAEAAEATFGQPAVAGPVAFGPRLIVSAADGTLLVLDRP